MGYRSMTLKFIGTEEGLRSVGGRIEKAFSRAEEYLIEEAAFIADFDHVELDTAVEYSDSEGEDEEPRLDIRPSCLTPGKPYDPAQRSVEKQLADDAADEAERKGGVE